MNATVVAQLIDRIDCLWPDTKSSREQHAGAGREWAEYLAPLDAQVAWEAMRILREHCRWRPSIADFTSAYAEAVAVAQSNVLGLPAGYEAEEGESLTDRFGHPENRVYCWRCDMALSLDERYRRPGYDGRRGFYHHSCPKPGSAPLIPHHERVKRDKQFSDQHVTIGPNVDPHPYVEERPKKKPEALSLGLTLVELRRRLKAGESFAEIASER